MGVAVCTCDCEGVGEGLECVGVECVNACGYFEGICDYTCVCETEGVGMWISVCV